MRRTRVATDSAHFVRKSSVLRAASMTESSTPAFTSHGDILENVATGFRVWGLGFRAFERPSKLC